MKKAPGILAVAAIILIAVLLIVPHVGDVPVEKKYLSADFDSLVTEWGWPQKYYGGGVVNVWHFEDGTVFVGGITEGKLTDYAHFGADRKMLSGTIPAHRTRLYLILRTLFDPDYQEHIYDTGSGFYIYTAILPDGHLLQWQEGFPGALDGYASDCFSPAY